MAKSRGGASPSNTTGTNTGISDEMNTNGLGASANTDFDSEVAANDNTLADPLQDPVTGATSGIDSEVPMATSTTTSTSPFNDVTDTATTTTGLSSTGTDFDAAPVYTGTTSTEATAVGASTSSTSADVIDKAKDVTGQAKEQVGQAVGQVKDQAGQALGQAKEQAGQVLGQVKEQAGQALEQGRGQIVTQLNEQKSAAAEGLAGLVGALHQAATPFRDANVPYVAEYAESFASQVDRFAGYLRENDVEELARDVERVARQNPMAFVGAAFVVGLGVARFLKSSRNNAGRYNYDHERSHALVPTNGGGLPARSGRLDQNSETYGERPKSANNYVPGIGVVTEHAPNV